MSTPRCSPAYERLYQLPPSYAKPVVRGWMMLPQAQAGLRASTYRVYRAGGLGPHDPEPVYAGLRHFLDVWIEQEEIARGRARAGIERTLKPLIARRRPSNVLLAEAHNVNGAAGFPLGEGEVSEVVAIQLYWALPPAPRVARGGLHG